MSFVFYLVHFCSLLLVVFYPSLLRLSSSCTSTDACLYKEGLDWSLGVAAVFGSLVVLKTKVDYSPVSLVSLRLKFCRFCGASSVSG